MTVQRAATVSSMKRQRDHSIAELEKYKLLVESVHDYAIFLMDKDGYIQTWNKGAQKIKGYAAEEIIGKHFSNFYLQRDIDAKKPERELELAQQYGRVEDEDWRVRKDGSMFWANVVITALHDDDNELVGFAKVTRDLTERKQHEDELRSSNIQLEHQHRELERLNSSKDEFISLASHQLRTPATAIKQLLGMLVEDFGNDVPPSILPIIRRAYDSNERQLSIVNSLLKVAQVDAGHVRLNKAPQDLRALLTDIIGEQAESFARKNQKVHLNNSDAPVFVHIDKTHMRMALENLIDNASKYMNDGGEVVVTLGIDKKYARVTIKDEGVGIAQEDIPRLFEKFSRIPNEMSNKVVGSGLGLYWSHKIIALHDGHVDVRSKLGKGTSFDVYIPLG